MKSRRFGFRAIAMIVMILAVGCALSSPEPVTLPKETLAPPFSTIMIAPTLPVSSSPTPIALPTVTPALLSTLPVEEARAKLLGLLSNNSGCCLPCLWGITPGRSTLQDAQMILVPLSSLSALKPSPPSPLTIDPIYKADDLDIVTNLSITYGNDGIIDNIFFQARGFRVGEPANPTALKPVFDSGGFGERLLPYTLSQVLSEHGTPADVLVSTNGGESVGNHVPAFYILLIYPEQGILINYTTYKELIGPNVHGCPANAHVEMRLYPTGNNHSFFELLEQTDWRVKMDYYKSLEDVTSMSREEFYQAFREPTDECIETPATLWPTPEN